MKLLSKMIALVATKFNRVVDKQGVPYFQHCYTVMQTCGLKDEASLCIALGHDLIEDTDVTFDYLYKEFGEEIALGILNLTKCAEEDYEDYIKTVANNPEIVPIKLADLKHNLEVSRLKGLTKKDFDRVEKYLKSYHYLSKL